MSKNAGKGDTPRPLSIPKKEFNNKFEDIFGSEEDRKKKAQEKEDEEDHAIFDPNVSALECPQPDILVKIRDSLFKRLGVPARSLLGDRDVGNLHLVMKELGYLWQRLLDKW
jgi:hypothetical protein